MVGSDVMLPIVDWSVFAKLLCLLYHDAIEIIPEPTSPSASESMCSISEQHKNIRC
jgi:hypothetical protein